MNQDGDGVTRRPVAGQRLEHAQPVTVVKVNHVGRRCNVALATEPVPADDCLGVTPAEPGVRFERRDLNVGLGLRMGSSAQGFYHDCKNSEIAAQGTSTIDKL
jgi:hypothetical protein